ncbi:exportin-7-B isoform X13 [Ostrinia furnacalis]|uniref:exportin-7-B isoform X1 n=1 Tax=Ostrinia furnacalis TaxID=93504 RepID=UPI00103D9CEB|nr:exportin-7-B isoform X1 [Ostrinia furnacalis]XP_028165262.1 exportin-7-B isoform X2 [Ostrinia furnacalis]XP_028165269.1 exportin-7-B isoform X3 [Ostrinia furnacalis]XP_028165273.1 exportin-7-B isoform X4 [Ostrinia furnacalis]XP_028165277.1 exportin-7-B isoform X5 [Ostrinia furnacalis]XP_028165287.1 exportin-7-B isoform X6 [Ostrinia furnacalis]XP_028165296.1 exportin-7-B isoform X7 [Ostrinia furnacalis]XP_028165303.1 exportin-7-B isoform X8 [Ostrinia furnacalis]XP_028165311.1 exportin-7-B
MAEEQEVIQIEILCKQLYESQDPILRDQAEKAVVSFQESPDTLSKCQALLERADSCYSQLLAATTLTKLINREKNYQSSTSLSVQQLLDIRNYVLNYLATRPKLANFVVQSLVSLFARITKLSWFDTVKEQLVFQNVMGDITSFLQGPAEMCTIGVQLLSQLVVEMNQMTEREDANRGLCKHRKISSSFRDTQLFEMFRLACSLLSAARAKALDLNDERQITLIAALLRLAHNCLTFDFIGTNSDEASDDLCTVQIPTSWRPTFLESGTLDLFFELYHALGGGPASLALALLVQLASVRRSLFSNNERAKFLNRLAAGVLRILENTQGLSDPTNYHEFCRLLARLKTNYQLGELVMVDNYPRLIELIAKFTVQSLQMWQFAPNSVHYLLSLWQRMVASVPYVKATEPHLLETYAPGVTAAYIESRLNSVPCVVRDGLEDPLDEAGTVQQQLEQLSVVARCEYAKSCRLLVAHFDRAAAAYSVQQNPQEILVLQGQLTWLVYIIGAAIGGRASVNTCDENDAMDGELVCRVLQLMDLTDSRLASGGCEKLELAMMSFFEHFRKIYVGEQVQKNSKVYRCLSEVLGLNDESQLLSVIMRKIITNLKYWGGSEQIIAKTLGLLSDLSGGYSCVRKLVKLDETQLMLTHHTAEHFPFLGIAGVGTAEMRCRTMLYTALGRLLMVELGEDEDTFHTFMMPITAAMESIIGLLGPPESPLFASEDAKKTLIGLARDLRGLAFAFNTKTTYMMLFDWIYPLYIKVLIRGIEVWFAEPALTTPVLKLTAELAQNRNQRLQLDVSSPNGILLFRELSNIICAYGSRILTVDVSKKQMYAMKLKGISLCFSILKAALCGNYANFGVFRLYGDEALDNALNMFVKLLLSIPQSDLHDYPKLSQTYYVLLERLAQDLMPFLASLQPEATLYILASISEGLTALDTSVCTGCCATLDHIVTYLFKQLVQKSSNKPPNPRQPPPEASNMLQVLQRRPEIMQQLLATVLNVIMFEDCCNQWSMSRPLLGLILLNEEHFARLRGDMLAQQPRDKQPQLAHCFSALMAGVEPNLLTKNRDRFTQNLSIFRRDINDLLKGTLVNTSNVNDMMTS